MAYKNITILLIVTLLTLQLVPSSEAGIKKFFNDAVQKVKNIFKCESHENEEEHLNAIKKDGSVNTLDGIGDSKPVEGSTTKLPNIDIRIQDPDADFEEIDIQSRVLINPPPNCPPGQRKGHDGVCRQVV